MIIFPIGRNVSFPDGNISRKKRKGKENNIYVLMREENRPLASRESRVVKTYIILLAVQHVLHVLQRSILIS